MDKALLAADRYIFGPLETGLSAIGIDNPLKTTIFVAILTSGVFWSFKPVLFFDRSGAPRPWNLILRGTDEVGPEPTPVPWYLAATTIGYVAGLII